jgi:hypothetical protein
LAKLKQRTDLPEDANKELQGLFERIGLPLFVQRLKDENLTPQEMRLLERKKFVEQTHPQVVAAAILQIVASQRKMTLERAQLDLARALDMLGGGRYAGLRRAIGEPITEKSNVPVWIKDSGELRFRNKVVRRVDTARATNVCLILNSFQEQAWQPSIDSPFPAKTRQLVYAVDNLNEGLTLIKFGTAQARRRVHWRPLS